MSEARIDPAAFRAYDIRGKVPGQLHGEMAGLVGQALATKALGMGVSRILVGRDGRESSEALASALIGGINNEGIDTLDVGLVPTPLAYWGATTMAAGNCAMVTGSHNPKEYNGIKMALAGNPLAGDDIQEIRSLVEDGRMVGKGVAGIAETDGGAAARYADAVLAGRSLERPVKVVVDCGNGAAGPTYPAILERLGCEVVPLFCEVDGDFPNHHPDPANPDNYAQAVGAMEESGAELVMSFDGDGDRLGVWLPGKGMLFPDRMLMVLARELLRERPGARVVYDVKCSFNVAPFVESCGGVPHLCRTGHSFVKREIAETGALLGGELSGHFFFNEGDWRFDDALLAAVKFLEVVSRSESAEKLCETVPDSCATPERYIHLGDGADPHGFVDKLAEGADMRGSPRIVTVDGMRAEWDDGFGLVRASNTTPSLVLRFEGSTQESLARIKEDFRSLLLAGDPGMEVPF